MNFFKNLMNTKLDLKRSIRYQSVGKFSDYLSLLGYMGKIDEIYFSLRIVDKNFISSHLSALTDCRVYNNLESLIAKIDGSDPYKLKKIIFEPKSDDFDLYKYFLNFFNALKSEESSHEENFVLNFLLNQVLNKNVLDADLAIKLVEYFYKVAKCNNYRKDYCIFSMVDFFLSNNNSKFFLLKKQFYNHIQKIYHQMYRSSFLTQDEREVYQKIVGQVIKKINGLKAKSKYRVAVCISGLYRNHLNSLQSIKENIVDPLNADVFIHTWDKKAIWTGLGGTPGYDRVFGHESSKFIPREIHNLNNLKNYMPAVYENIRQPIYVDWAGEELERILKPKKMLIENQDEFEQSLSDPEGYTLARGSLNQIKMFYGLKKSFDLALDEQDYDFIIRIRPDVLVTSSISVDDIAHLNHNTIYTGVGFFGLQDFEFVLSSSAAYNFSAFTAKMFEFKTLSLYENFPLYDAHNLMFSWLLDFNYSFGPDLFKRTLLNSSIQKIVIPGLENSIQHDCKTLSDENKAKFSPFLAYLNSNYC